ncbi:MAG: hypothetical protein V8T10_02755 [Merdibacter sp.]
MRLQGTHDQVLVTCYPLQYLVEQIAQDRVSCVLLSENTLIQRAQIRDDYQELLAQSDALLYLGGLESYYEAYADEITDSRIEQVNLVDQLGNFPFLRYGENEQRSSHGMREMPLTMSICIIPIPRCGWMR